MPRHSNFVTEEERGLQPNPAPLLRAVMPGPDVPLAPPEPHEIAAASALYNRATDDSFYIWQVKGRGDSWRDLPKAIALRFEEGVVGTREPFFTITYRESGQTFFYDCWSRYQENPSTGEKSLVRRVLIRCDDIIMNLELEAMLQRFNEQHRQRSAGVAEEAALTNRRNQVQVSNA